MGFSLTVVGVNSYPHRGEGGGGALMEPAWVFVVLQYFEMISLLVDSLWCTLQDEGNIMG